VVKGFKLGERYPASSVRERFPKVMVARLLRSLNPREPKRFPNPKRAFLGRRERGKMGIQRRKRPRRFQRVNLVLCIFGVGKRKDVPTKEKEWQVFSRRGILGGVAEVFWEKKQKTKLLRAVA
jgi:hypothetical protein